MSVRRIMNMLGVGRVRLTDDTGPAQVNQVQSNGLETRDMPSVSLYGLASNPHPGADAVVLFLGGDRGKGVVIATADGRYRLRNLAPGEVGLYTDEGDSVILRRGRIVVVTAGTELRITAPLVTVSGDLHVAGAVVAGYGGADQVGLQTHRHTQGVDGHGDTEAPISAPTAGT